MGKFLPLQTFLAVKDGWDRNTKVTAQVIVGTPGTVMDMIGKRVLDVKGVKVLVLDEADDMLDIQGLGDHTLRIKKSVSSWESVRHFLAGLTNSLRRL
jgi:ATP-dependent RNA helicase DDX19/DBP5